MTVGTETWTFADGTLEAWQTPLIAGARAYNLELVDETTGAALHATYDVDTRTVALVNVARGAVVIDYFQIPDGAVPAHTQIVLYNATKEQFPAAQSPVPPAAGGGPPRGRLPAASCRSRPCPPRYEL